jgi:hypothetical protein
MHFYNKLTYVNVWSLQRVIFTDASQFAGAGFTVGDNTIVHFMWEKQDRDKSSTWRELKTVAQIISKTSSCKLTCISKNNALWLSIHWNNTFKR